MVYNIYSNIHIIYQALFLKLKTQPPSRRARYYSYELDMVWTSFIPIWWDCWLLELELNKNNLPYSRYGSKLCTPKHQVQCIRITNTPRKKRESLLCEVVCQPLREKDWATQRRTDGSERQQRWRKREAATATGAVGDSAGDGATGLEWECESERELDFSWERERLRVRGNDVTFEVWT